MLGSRFFWKLYLAFAVLVVMTLAATGFLVHQQLRATLLAGVESRLLDMATALTPYSMEAFERHARHAATESTDGIFDAALQAEVERIGRSTSTRITLVAPDGLVLADSESDPLEMDNHGGRPEIVASRTRPYGVSRRFSDTVGQSLLYVAITLRSADREAGTVRTSIPLVDVDARLAALRNTIVLGAGLGMLIALGVGLFVAGRITAPLSEMTEAADALRAGRYDHRVETHGADEFALLGETLNRLADELSQRIATLAEQRAQLGAMIAGLQEGVFAVDESDTLIFHNHTADTLLGIDEGMSGGSLWGAMALPELEEMCAATRASGQPSRRELVIERDGTEFILDARATAFEADGQQGVVAVLHDITNLRRLEQMRTEFVANVSHELKTPLTSIRGYVETLIDGAIHDDANNLRFLRKIDQQVGRLTAMVTDVLSLARIEATSDVAPSGPTDWRAVVESTVGRFRENGLLAEHRFEVELGEVAVPVGADASTMTQILDNLLDNAIKYTPAGGTITVRVFARDGQAALEVSDTGIGISAIDRARIFERFFRADRARSRDTGGTGLGLAIVKHLAQSFDGEVRVESALGSGSTFGVWAPTVAPRRLTEP